MKTFFRLFIAVLLPVMAGCTSQLPEEEEEKQEIQTTDHPTGLTGTWTASGTSPLAKTLTLSEDGTGRYTTGDFSKGQLTWGAGKGQLSLILDDGKQYKGHYHVQGSTLYLADNQGKFTIDCPIVGKRWQSDAVADFFRFYFLADGTGSVSAFGKDNILGAAKDIKWSRLDDKQILLIIDKKYTTLNFDSGTMTIGNNIVGTYHPVDHWQEARWEAGYTESGPIAPNDSLHNSTVNISWINDNSYNGYYFYCQYFSKGMNGKYYPSSYGAKCSFFEDFILLKEGTDGEDATLVNFRFLRRTDRKELTLELSRDDDFKTYTGFDRTKPQNK